MKFIDLNRILKDELSVSVMVGSGNEKVAIDIEGLAKQIEIDEGLIADPSFYEDLSNSQKVLKKSQKSVDKLKRVW